MPRSFLHPANFRLRRTAGHCLLALGLLLGGAVTLSAQPTTLAAGTYSRARVWLGAGGLAQLQRLGVAVDHGTGKNGAWFESDFSARELAVIQHAGLRYEVQLADVATHYYQQNTLGQALGRPTTGGLTCDPVTTWRRPQTFRQGTMGGFFTLEEVYQKLDSMALRWPNLITVRQAVGPTTTHEGRQLFYVKISDNPAANEAEPEMLYTGAHHAREPMSVAHLLYYMYFLLENYATNPEVKALVDNTQLYFVPVMNPDGYAYNEATNPGGGGMWRKNRRDNQDGTFGVDLNRNYSESWGLDDVGSSPLTWSEVYRGPSAFSEPETQLIRDFSLQHSFRTALNYHSFGNVFIYPYGYANVYTPDSAQFTEYGRWLTRDDRYSFGTCQQVLGYVSNGDANDWQYATVQGPKPKTFSFTPEIGKASEGFWPPSSRIETLCDENMTRSYETARLLLAEAATTDLSPRFFPQRAAWVRYSLKQLGFTVPGTYTVAVEPLAGSGTAGAARTYTFTSVLETREDSIALTLPATLSVGQTFRYVLSVNNGLFTRRDTLTKVFGAPAIAFASDGASLAGWVSSGLWGVVPGGFGTTPGALNDSPGGIYAVFAEESLQTAQPIDLRGAVHAELSFRAKWAIETRFDFAQVQVSTDNGTSWQPLCSRYTRPGNAFQRDDEPLYDGFVLNWVHERISLDDFVGQQVLLRFELVADDQVGYDGFTLDDVLVERIGGVMGLATANPAPAGLGVFPNPAHTMVTLVSPAFSTTGAAVQVTDALGRTVYTSTLPNGAAPHTFPVRGWAPGLYHVRLVAEGWPGAHSRFAVE